MFNFKILYSSKLSLLVISGNFAVILNLSILINNAYQKCYILTICFLFRFLQNNSLTSLFYLKCPYKLSIMPITHNSNNWNYIKP